ncbi:MAG TPA: hypothetical protein VEK83_09845 [Gemmatimonadales bacterium]|nr:hypothetical protein [Gemmatimonadales bacterium]
MTLHRWFAIAVVAAELAACSSTDRPAPAGPSFDVMSNPVLSGSVLGPDGGNICNSLPGGGRIQINVINMGAFGAPAGAQFFFCPQNTFTFSLAPGTYLVRARLPFGGAIASGYPWQTYLLTPVELAGDLTADITVTPGSPLGGGVTINGQPFAGVNLSLVHADATLFGVTVATSSADGGWEEFIGRPQTILQNGIRVRPNIVCDLLGTRLLTPVSFEPFEFPDEESSYSCDMVDAPAQQFSHVRTRLVVTPGPGDVGAGQLALTEDLGNGWGVQFPVNPGEKPRFGDITVSQLFLGGLLIGIRPDRLLSANELNGYIQCGNCRAFGPEGRLHFTSSPQYGTKVTWQYSDASSSQGIGLKVVQKSYDGVPPADYVLFRFTLTNGGAAPITIYPGFFADWDIDDDFQDDVGATEGRLMYMTNAGGGTAGGSVIISDAPVSGTAFFTDFGQTTAEIVSALAGDFSNPSADEPGDHRYVQSIGPITLPQGAATQFWLAIVAGEGLDQLRSNAAAAAADVAARRAQPDAADAVSSAGTVWSGGKSNARSAGSPACKKGCATVTQ